MWFEQLIIHHHFVIYCLTNHITGGSDYSYNECVYYAVDVRCYDQLSFETSSFLPVADSTNIYCCQFLAFQKTGKIWLPNRDCVQLTSETSYLNNDIGVNALTKSSSNWYFLFWYRALPVIFFLKLNENVYVYQSLVFFKGKVWC